MGTERRWNGVAAGGCGAALGAIVVGCGGLGGLGLIGGLVVWTTWENAARALVEAQTRGEVTFERLSVGLGAVNVRGLTVHRRSADGDVEVLRIDHIALGGGLAALGHDPVELGTITIEGVHVAMTRDDAGWMWPEATWTLLDAGSTTYDWPALHAAEVQVYDVTAAGTTPDGTAVATIDEVHLQTLEASLDGGLAWSIASGSVSTGRLTVEEREVATLAALQLRRDHVLEVTSPALAVSVRSDHSLVLPPVVADPAPVWLGGHRDLPPSEAPWMGLATPGDVPLPWTPVSTEIRDARIGLTDGTFVSPPIVWDVAVPSAVLGPVDGETLPVHADFTLASGTGSATGTVAEDGTIRLDVDYGGGDARFFEPYVRPTLRKLSVTLDRGVASAKLGIELKGSRIATRGNVAWSNVRFTAAKSDDGGSRIVAVGSRLLTETEDEPYVVPVQVRGDLTDPHFSLVRQVLDGFDDAVSFGATRTIGGALGTVKSTWRKVFGD